ncbi:MAG: DUF4157 domain-containing protein [Symploca sp. SIO2B6]|nr:DUF4157 domain-containing protein [Symploca sp. SIO2B6]
MANRSYLRSQAAHQTSSKDLPLNRLTSRSFGLQAKPETTEMGQEKTGYQAKPFGFDITTMPLQTKLTVGAVDDPYEQEAVRAASPEENRVAAEVVQRINQPQPSVAESKQQYGANNTVQRQDLSEDKDMQMQRVPSLQREEALEDDNELQRSPVDILQRQEMPDEKEELQMKPSVQRVGAEGGAVSDEFEQELNSARGGGQALAPELQAQMGQAMGADFSGVRIHTDGRSNALNESVGARAFTTGQDVFFKRGEYQPGSRGGQELIAHELTHVVQQKSGVERYEHTRDEFQAAEDSGECKQNYIRSISSEQIQRTYTFKGDKYGEEEKRQQDLTGEEKGEGGQITSARADKAMPTHYSIIKGLFGDEKTNTDFFKATKKDIENTCDRPHEVGATIIGTGEPNKMREGLPVVTAIGNLGNQELTMRDGADEERKTKYDGGHLVGYQVLGGQEADKQWNVAPQDGDNNKFAYNNTIEEMLRGPTAGTQIDYQVEVKYTSLNFKINQYQLKEHGVITKYDSDVPWEIQLPSRIPSYWKATAEIVSKGDSHKFGSPTIKEDGKEKKTYAQESQNMESPLDQYDDKKRARYRLTYNDAEEEKIEQPIDKKTIGKVRKVLFEMHQAPPLDLGVNQKLDDWEGEEVADYGKVEVEKITIKDIEKLKKEIEEIDKDDMDLDDEGSQLDVDDCLNSAFENRETLKNNITKNLSNSQKDMLENQNLEFFSNQYLSAEFFKYGERIINLQNLGNELSDNKEMEEEYSKKIEADEKILGSMLEKRDAPSDEKNDSESDDEEMIANKYKIMRQLRQRKNSRMNLIKQHNFNVNRYKDEKNGIQNEIEKIGTENNLALQKIKIRRNAKEETIKKNLKRNFEVFRNSYVNKNKNKLRSLFGGKKGKEITESEAKVQIKKKLKVKK